MFDYQFTPYSFRRLKKLPPNIQRRIINKLDFFCCQEDPLVFAETLIERKLGSYRFRVGSYRVIFDVEDKNLVIHDVGHRRDIYR